MLLLIGKHVPGGLQTTENVFCPFVGRYQFIYKTERKQLSCDGSELSNCPHGNALGLRFGQCKTKSTASVSLGMYCFVVLQFSFTWFFIYFGLVIDIIWWYLCVSLIMLNATKWMFAWTFIGSVVHKSGQRSVWFINNDKQR